MNLSVHDRTASTSTRKPTVILLSGESGNGKTTLCTQVVASLKSKGLNIAGLVTLPRFSNGKKAGMEAEAIRTGERRTLAERDAPIAGRITRHWRFRGDSLRWGMQVLRDATPCDLLVVDELGPLELIRNEGWAAAIDVLHACEYGHALVTVRPALMIELQRRLEGIDLMTLTVTRSNQEELLARIIARVGGTR